MAKENEAYQHRHETKQRHETKHRHETKSPHDTAFPPVAVNHAAVDPAADAAVGIPSAPPEGETSAIGELAGMLRDPAVPETASPLASAHAAESPQTAASLTARDTAATPGTATTAEAPTAPDNSAPATVDTTITFAAAGIILAVVAWALFGTDSFGEMASAGLDFVVVNFGWAFIMFGTIFVAFIIVMALSKFGSIRLGANDEQPEFSTVSWIAMMFAAGMGIGLLFYGASEPLSHYRTGVPGYAAELPMPAMAATLYHWTLHPWAIYAVVGLAIAYSTFRLGRKQLVSQSFTPLFGTRAVNGWPGKVIDVMVIIATVFGTACSLGIGATQINAGLKAAGFVDNPTKGAIIGIVAVLTLAFLLSAMSGVGRGIQYLSNTNMVLAAILAIFVFLAGPTVSILNYVPSSVATYISQFFEMAGRTAESDNGTAAPWLSAWTIFYWAWWISWSPFVGMFLARISRGRTVREFCLCVLFMPAAVSVVWFAIFGGTAISLEQSGNSIYGDGSAEYQLFDMLHTMPGGTLMGVVAMVLLGTFFITSADSASTVMGSLAQNGAIDAKPWLSALWGLLTSIIAVTLLVSGGAEGLTNLQNATIIAASPFLIVLVGLMIAIVKDMRHDVIYREQRESREFALRLARERRLYAEQRRRVDKLRLAEKVHLPSYHTWGRAPRD